MIEPLSSTEKTGKVPQPVVPALRLMEKEVMVTPPLVGHDDNVEVAFSPSAMPPQTIAGTFVIVVPPIVGVVSAVFVPVAPLASAVIAAHVGVPGTASAIALTELTN